MPASEKSPRAKLDGMIKRAKSYFYRAIAVAEVLHRVRIGTATLDDYDRIRRDARGWLDVVARDLFGKPASLNQNYWDHGFSKMLNQSEFKRLADLNGKAGVIEAYVFERLRLTCVALSEVRLYLANSARLLDFARFLKPFETDTRLARSSGPAYEIAVHALFNAVATRLRATVTLSIRNAEQKVLNDFADFCQLMLGLERGRLEREVPAKLYRSGLTSSADAGLDMWANFGPAIQVKHITLEASRIPDIVDPLDADDVVVVCKHMERASIESFVRQWPGRGRLRGIITEVELRQWFSLAFSEAHSETIGRELSQTLLRQFDDEFPLADPSPVARLMESRGYRAPPRSSEWWIDESTFLAPQAKWHKRQTQNPGKQRPPTK